MNFVYGAIAVILSLVVSKIFVKKGASSGRVLGFTFLLEYIVISSILLSRRLVLSFTILILVSSRLICL